MRVITAAVIAFGVSASAFCAQPAPDRDSSKRSLQVGLSRVTAGQYQQAVKPLRDAMRDPALKEQAQFLLGTVYFELRRHTDAIALLEPLRGNAKFAENALYLLEESYRLTRNGPGAERAFADLLQQFPDSALVAKLLGTAYDADGKYREALAEFEKASAKDPTLPQVRFAAGLVCLKLHDEAHAREWFEKERAINPCFPPALFYLGEIQRSSSDLPGAEAWYRKALKCDPSNADSNLGLGVVLQGQDRDSEALPFLRKAVSLMPDKSEAHARLARSLAKVGDTEAAQAEMKKARELAASNSAPEAATTDHR